MRKITFLFFILVSQSFGQSKCYLDYHMKHSTMVDVFCWGSNTERFLDTLSTNARHYLDSVFNKFGVNAKTVVCQKVKLSESGQFLKGNYIDNSNYFCTTFERTFDCYDNWTYKNYRGRTKINPKTKVILEYMVGVKKNFEMLRIYIINDKKMNNISLNTLK